MKIRSILFIFYVSSIWYFLFVICLFQKQTRAQKTTSGSCKSIFWCIWFLFYFLFLISLMIFIDFRRTSEGNQNKVKRNEKLFIENFISTNFRRYVFIKYKLLLCIIKFELMVVSIKNRKYEFFIYILYIFKFWGIFFYILNRAPKSPGRPCIKGKFLKWTIIVKLYFNDVLCSSPTVCSLFYFLLHVDCHIITIFYLETKVIKAFQTG